MVSDTVGGSRKTDVRWSPEEWAALGRYAASFAPAQSRGLAVKYAMQRFLEEEGFAVGPAAPEERESGAVVARRLASKRSAGSSGPNAGSASSRPAPEYVAEPVVGGPPVPNVGRLVGVGPVGSAGSSGPVPPAGVAAPPVFPPLAGGAPELDAPAAPGMVLQRAVELALMRRGVAPSLAKLQALKAIRGGKVVIDGDVCTDPAALVDPRDLG